MTLLWIFLGAVAAITGVGVLAARLTDDRGQRASGEHTFRAAHPTPVTLPYMAAGSYSSVQERHRGRPGELHKDVLAATLHNPGLLDDIRTERTKNHDRPADSGPRRQGSLPLGVDRLGEAGRLDLPGRGALTSADMTKLAPAGELHDPECDRSLDAVLICAACASQVHAGEPGTNQRQGNWKSRPTYTPHQVIPAHVIAALEHASSEDTTVSSLHPAIRADVDGDNNGQITDRYFSQISLTKIFADLGITYTRTQATA